MPQWLINICNFHFLFFQVLQTRKHKVENDLLSEFEKNDILSIMMKERDEKTGLMFTDQLIQDSCFTFMLAGYETTATALPIVLYHLSMVRKNVLIY